MLDAAFKGLDNFDLEAFRQSLRQIAYSDAER